MAFNLNKNDNSSNVDLSKKVNSKFDLSKNDEGSSFSKSNANQNEEKKKSPILYIVAALVLLGLGIFWFINHNKNISDTVAKDTNESSAPADVSQSASTKESQPVQAVDNKNAPQEVTEQQSSASKNTDNVQPNVASNVEAKSTNMNNSAIPAQNTIKATSNLSTQLQGTLEEKARQVIRGDFGNGEERKKALGEQYEGIQEKVNEILKVPINN